MIKLINFIIFVTARNVGPLAKTVTPY
jgi:hypothetical protein